MAASLAAGPAFGQSAPAVKGNGSKVLFGIGLSAPFLAFVPWVDKGIAAKHGVNAEYKIFESGLGGVEAVVAGNGHVCVGSEVNMSRPRLSGGSIVSVARCLVARRDQGIGVGPGIESRRTSRARPSPSSGPRAPTTCCRASSRSTICAKARGRTK